MPDIFPESRDEAILLSMINGEEYTGFPESRIEVLLLQLKATLEDWKSKTKGAYVFHGSIEFSELPSTLTEDMVGWTYNMLEEFTTDDRFVDGAGKVYPAGTNVVIANVGTDETPVLKFDVTSAFVDVNAIYSAIDNIADMIADEFDEDEAYAVGDIVWYVDDLYTFVSPHTAGDPWSNLEVNMTTVDEIINAVYADINNTISDIEDMIANQFNAAIAYSEDDYVIYQNGLYKFTSDHAAGAAWDPSIVNLINVTAAIKQIESALSGKQDTLTFDDAPTESSNNPVKSGGVYTALSGKQNNLSATKDANNDVTFLGNVIDGAGNVLSEVSALEQSASGNPIIVNAQPVDAKELSVELEPIQDLHGYDHPWAGGAGKNKFNPENVLDSYFNDSTPITSFFKTRTIYAPCKTSTQYTISKSAGARFVVAYTKTTPANGVEVYGVTINNTASSITITTGADAEYIVAFVWHEDYDTLTAAQMIATCQIEEGSTATSYAPYSNICPISGRTETSVWADSKYKAPINWNQLMQNGNFASTSGWAVFQGSATLTANNNVLEIVASTENISIASYFVQSGQEPNGHKYLITADIKASVSGMAADSTYGQTPFSGEISTTWSTKSVIKVPANQGACFVGLRINTNANTGTVYMRNVNVVDLTQLFGTTIADYIYSLEQATAGAGVAWFKNLFYKDYYPYNAGEETCVGAVNGDPYRHITISFGQTVYGARINFKTGEGIVDRALATFDGSSDENWDVSNDRFRCRSLPNEAIDNAAAVNGISNEYNVYSANELYGNRQTANWIGCAVSKTEFLIVDNVKFANKDLSEFKTWLASNPVQICYKLATPITLTLTPSMLKLLEGYNYITADGDMQLVYIPESVLEEAQEYTDSVSSGKVDNSVVGTVENGTTASKAYAVGAHFTRNKKFCTAIASIASGATLTLNTNYVEGTIADTISKKTININASSITATDASDFLKKLFKWLYENGYKNEMSYSGYVQWSGHENYRYSYSCIGARRFYFIINTTDDAYFGQYDANTETLNARVITSTALS